MDNEVLCELLNTGAATGEAKEVERGLPYAVIPQGYSIESLEKQIYNKFNERPHRLEQTVNVLDTQSFIDYWSDFNVDTSRIFADEIQAKVLAVMDYHESADAPKWNSHKLVLTLRTSEQLKRWLDQNNKQMSQKEFSEFLEQNSVDISKPAPAAIMEVARDLEAKTDVQFASAMRMADGQVKFKYTEETKATVGGGEVAVPDKFTITVPVYIGSHPVNIEALLRFRVNSGKLAFWYTLIRPEDALRLAFNNSRNAIAAKLQVQIINGSLG